MKDTYPEHRYICISSEQESTTDDRIIRDFLKRQGNKIVCITYQSFETLLYCLGELRINICCYDEAHHAVGQTYQGFIFNNQSMLY